MNTVKKISAVFTMTVIMLVAFSTQASAYVSYKTLSVTAYKQEETNWCWAATSKTIIEYLGKGSPTQSQIVKGVKGSVVNEGATTSEDKESLTDWDVDTTVTQDSVPFGTIVNDIENYRPLKAGIMWKNGNGGHDFVIYGYYQDSDNSKYDVYYSDPIDGSKSIKSYSSFDDNTSFSWYDSYYNNH
ncbi:papain-like cysteine protease family protein [Paenibacillus sp. DMB20]|uniref:papain-like cysteine protease family protein n=1 Tax=Paenibacillus sp. DMB20 TaxID=1642570 RepID=UPI00069C2126|nr:papain-like cysteine protease family protein [Paenibacillus sp. DMB20]